MDLRIIFYSLSLLEFVLGEGFSRRYYQICSLKICREFSWDGNNRDKGWSNRDALFKGRIEGLSARAIFTETMEYTKI